MQGDGNLVVYSSSHNPLVGLQHFGEPDAYLVLGDNGILTVDSSAGVGLWGKPGVLVPGAQLTSASRSLRPTGNSA